MKKILVAVLLLAGCVTSPTIPIDASGAQKTRVDQRLLKKCAKFSDIKSNPQPSEVLEQHNKDAAVLKDCSDRVDALIEFVNRSFPQD